jgi:hypothetical protein
MKTGWSSFYSVGALHGGDRPPAFAWGAPVVKYITILLTAGGSVT